MMKNLKSTITALVLVLLLLQIPGWAQTYSRQDSLRGSITPERAWWDLTFYHLDIKVDPSAKTIEGTNTVVYKVLEPHQVIQIDLQPPLVIKSVTQNGADLDIKKEGNAHFITLQKEQKKGEINELIISYGGTPKEAVRPPWDGGITWSQDSNGKPFVSSSCQGIGASIWWPNKDHMYDEVDSMLVSVEVPSDLMNIGNGRLRGVDDNHDGTSTFHWFVDNPINNYGVNINIGDYVHWDEEYNGENGKLDLDYYVLRENLDKAKVQFTQTPMMMEAFEHWFGPYPFYKDGFKLVEVPYLGMEHQSSITYGNKFANGYLGRDLSGTGWGLKFDFIIIHESGHEWFANNITYKDKADMWIHESFTNYSESLYVEYHFGKEAGSEYVRGTRQGIANQRPIIADYGVNAMGSGDMYPKGGNILHTLRQLVDDDDKWRGMLRGLNIEFYHQTVTTKQIEDYLSVQSGMDLKPFFDQYLRDARLPILEYRIDDSKIQYRWTNSVRSFNMPLRVSINGKWQWIEPKTQWTTITVNEKEIDFDVDPNIYISIFNITGN